MRIIVGNICQQQMANKVLSQAIKSMKEVSKFNKLKASLGLSLLCQVPLLLLIQLSAVQTHLCARSITNGTLITTLLPIPSNIDSLGNQKKKEIVSTIDRNNNSFSKKWFHRILRQYLANLCNRYSTS